IELRFLSDRRGHDRARLEEGEALMRRLAGVAPLAELVAGEADPDGSEEDLARRVIGYNNAVGSCRMGPVTNRFAVADTRGLVRGVANVWIAHASLLPVVPAAPTNLTRTLIRL